MLRQRKDNDETRTRRNFESHLQFATPQRHYFEKLQSLTLESVRFVRAQNNNFNQSTIRAEHPSFDERAGRYSLDVLDTMFDWVKETSPS